jgi:branched-chain amino acid transport system ATP-binding protein
MLILVKEWILLNLESCDVYYGEIRALESVFISVENQEIVSIIGANGSGKSTLLKAIARIVPVYSGTIFFNGIMINKLSATEIVRMGISLVPEGRQVFNDLSVRDNLILGAFTRWGKVPKEEIQKEFDMVYHLFPILKQKAALTAGTLSGGEQQMLAIGRSLMLRPRLMLLDEPSMGLSPILVNEVFKTIMKLNEQGVTILLVEQNARIALAVSVKTYVLSNGKIVQYGDSKKLIKDEVILESYLGMIK